MHSRALAAVAVIVSLIAVAFVGFPPANAAPPQPHNFYGTAADSSSTPYPVGTRITAWIDGVDYSNGTSVYVSAPGPLGNYDMDVFGDNQTDVSGTGDNTPTVKTGGDINDEIMYVAGDFTTVKPLNPQQVFTAKDFWGSPTTGQSERLDLTAATTQPGLLKIGRIITQPNDPWPQYLFLCNPTSSPIDASQYYIEKPVPGSFTGPTHPLTGLGLVPPSNGTLYVNLTSWTPGGTTITTTGDTLKLVWSNSGGAFGGTDIIVDRVEFNVTFDPAVFVEPVNTIMTDALGPGLGQEIYRFRGNLCEDTNSNSYDFSSRARTARPAAGNTPPTVTVSTPSGVEDWTGNTVHSIFWNQSDAEDASLTVAIALSTNSGGSFPISVFGGTVDNSPPPSRAWTVACVNASGTAMIRIQVFDTGGAFATSFSNLFSIDCAAPTLVNTNPGDTATNVDVNTNVILTFIEGMNPAVTSGAISFVPPVTFNTTWGPSNVATVNPDIPLLGLQTYMVTIGCGARDDSDTGNALASCPRTFNFTTALSDPAPFVDLTKPDGNEVWTGNSVHTIFWNMTDNNPGSLTTTLEYSTNGGTSWNPVFTNQLRAQGANSFQWTVPCPSTLTARVRVTASDGVPQSTLDTSAQNFAIDCGAPTVLSTSPANTDFDVDVAEPLTVLFSEDMDQPTVALSLVPAVPGGLSVLWPLGDTLVATHNDLAECTTYTATVAATAGDLSDPGNPIGTAFTWSFDTECAPTIAITDPTAGEAFSCASSQTLRFTVTDTDANVFVWVNWTSPVLPPISQSSRPTGVEQAVPIVVPFANTTAAQITVTAQDSTNLIGVASVVFEIDCTPPRVLSSVPAAAATNAPLTDPFTITFSEDMDQTTACNAISLNPPAWTGNTQCTWTAPDVVQVAHAKLRAGQSYTLTVTTTARDASNPGMNLSPLYTATFTTTSSSGLTAVIAGPSTGQTGTQYTYDGSGSTPSSEITTYEWEFRDPNGVSSFPTPGESVAFTFSAAGTWTVILNVTDAAGNYDTEQLTVVISTGGGANFFADYWWLFLILIVAILGALFFLIGRRRKKDEEMPPEVPPEQVETMPPSRAPAWEPPPPPPPAAPMAPSKGKPMTRECPTCGTIVDTTDTECFMCGTKL